MEKMPFQTFARTISEMPRSLALILSFLIIFIISFFSYVNHSELVLSLFYVLPIMLLTWQLGELAGVSASLLCCLIWLFTEVSSGRIYADPFVPYENQVIRFAVFLIIVRILNNLHMTVIREQEMARADSLTGLLNGRGFYEATRRELQRAQRFNEPISAAFIDVDNFKAVNDILGHQTGDLLLQKVATILQENIRAIDMVARLGGDEFFVFMPQTSSRNSLAAMKRIQARLAEAVGDENPPVTFSIGLVTFTRQPVDIDEIIKIADEKMYFVKQNGKNSIEQIVV
jgi:diguanylate cyclase (GGDEF)-like protein